MENLEPHGFTANVTERVVLKKDTVKSLKYLDRLDQIFEHFDSMEHPERIEFISRDIVRSFPIQAPDRNSDIGEIMFKNALILIDNGEVQSAYDILKEVTSLSENSSWMYWKAWCLKNLGRNREAIEIYKNLTIDSANEELFFELGQLYYYRKDYSLAIQTFHSGLLLCRAESPRFADFYRYLGNSYLHTGDSDSAEENYNKALSLRPNSDVLLSNLGCLHFHKGEPKIALNYFAQAIKVNPSNVDCWIGLAMAAHEIGDDTWATAIFQKILDQDPTRILALQMFISICQAESNFGIAIERVKNYLAKVPDDMQMAYVLSGLCLQAGLRDESKRWIEVYEKGTSDKTRADELRGVMKVKYGS